MITMHDAFCGAGGSSSGAIENPGVRVTYALNHWAKAVSVHHSNHPDTDHVCADISQFNPRRIRSADLGWFSPECTNHSQAKGRRRVCAEPDLFGETLPTRPPNGPARRCGTSPGSPKRTATGR